MSQDLLSAFEDVMPRGEVGIHGKSAHASTSIADQSQLPSRQDDTAMDEEFGDFEDAEVIPPVEAAIPSAKPTTPTTVPRHASTRGSVVAQPGRSSDAASRKQSNNSGPSNLPFKPRPSAATTNDSRIGKHPFAEHMDVLFAADDDEYDAGQDEWNDLSNNPEAAMAYSKRIIQEQLEAQARQGAAPQTGHSPPTKELKPRNLDVLFDADDLSDGNPQDDEDTGDWGDFESVQHASGLNGTQDLRQSQTKAIQGSTTSDRVSQTATNPSMTFTFDLLGLDEPTSTEKTVERSPTPDPLDTTDSLAPRPILARSAASFNAIIEKGFTDAAWDDFDDTIQSTPAVISAEAARKGSITAQLTTMPKVPPANVPPPSVLLCAFPELLKQNVSQDTIPERLSNANVLAHIIAGRKLRWKRSSALSASMRIGPAAAGGKGGMKLTGLDRNETAREDREVAEVLAVWRAQLGRLRSAYATHTSAASAEGRLLQMNKLPEVSDPAPIKTLKPQEGGLSAPHECALCGLKRQERIANVDDNVDDSFGEWWAEGADMHTFCLIWWVKHEGNLRSR